MSNKDEALPTVAYDLSNIENPLQIGLEYAEDAVLFQREKGDELVKRKDVEALIQDKIERLEDEHDLAEDTQKPIIKWRIKAAESILDEVQSE